MGDDLQPQGTSMGTRTAKAGREQVLAAADAILQSGQRPTIEAIQARLGGGSPNSIVSYLRDWYGSLGERLTAVSTPAEGLLPEVHQAALGLQRALQRARQPSPTADSTESLLRALRAEIHSQRLLIEELRAQKERDLQAQAAARALLLRKDESLQHLNKSLAEALTTIAVLEQRLKARPVVRGAVKARSKPVSGRAQPVKRKPAKARQKNKAKGKARRPPASRTRGARRR